MKFKNYLLIGSALFATAVIPTSCDDDDPVDPIVNPQPDPKPDPEPGTETQNPFELADIVTWPADTVVNLIYGRGESLLPRDGRQAGGFLHSGG